MNKTLSDFAKFNIRPKALRNTLGKDLYHINHVVPETIFAKDVKNAIEKHLSGSISKEDLTEWVNIVWFTELFQYNETEEDSIASVITALETLDEDNVEFTIGDFDKMIKALENNTEYE